MRRNLLLLLSVLGATSAVTHAGVYKCEVDGATVYQQIPCNGADVDAVIAEQEAKRARNQAPPISSSGHAKAPSNRDRDRRPNALVARCKEKWPGNYRQQRYCIEKEMEAANQLAGLLKRYPLNTDQGAIIQRCALKWQDGETFNYRQVVYCSEKELEAYYDVSRY